MRLRFTSLTCCLAYSLVIAEELAAPFPCAPLPTPTSYHELYTVIEGGERVVQALRGFLASMGYIRGNGSQVTASGLNEEVLRGARSKLSRILARLRVYSTLVAS